MTADLRALYPHDTEKQAVPRALTRKRTASTYERARLTADALRARAHAVHRADRLGSRTRPRIAAPAAGADSDVTTVEQTRRTFAEAALARVQEGTRERALSPAGAGSSTSPAQESSFPGPGKRDGIRVQHFPHTVASNK
ncbi:hypothetical protein [Streptomyces atroolivaceus]|uniref:hypothetical protein n=1 Tax=Streptomyces atroolivaceus TaxID=66869 RepID=UPI00363A22F4